MLKKLLLLVTLITTITVGQHITGLGTEASPYLIYNAADFDSMRVLGMGTGAGINRKWYSIQNDIDFSGWGNFNAFTSTCAIVLEGNNHTLSNLTVVNFWNNFYIYVALFCRFQDGGEIKNITFDNLNITYNGGATYGVAAGLVGMSQSSTVATLSNVIIKNSLISITAGGVNNSYSLWVGGLSGNGYSISHYRCAFIDSRIIVSTSAGITQGAGGITGRQVATIDQCYTSNNYISWTQSGGGNATFSASIGGLAGYLISTANISNSYSYKDTLVWNLNSTSMKVGGLFGYNQSNAANTGRILSYTSPVISAGNTTARIGVFAGEWAADAGDYNWSSWADTSIYPYISIETGETDTTVAPKKANESEMKDQANFPLFDFTDIWEMSPSRQDGYPYLQWNLPPQQFALVTPQAGDSYTSADDLLVTWLGIDSVLFYYSVDSGDNFTFKDTITGYSYNWDAWADQVASNTVWVLITSLDGTLRDSCHSFAIIPNFTVTYPNGGETFNGDEMVNITYDSSVDSLILYYTIDNGSNWILIDTVVSTGSYSWDVPPVTTSLAKIRITTTDAEFVDESNAIFYLYSSEYIINILSPIDSVTTFNVGDDLDIIIETINVDSISLFYSINDSLNWIPIIQNFVITNSYPIPDTLTYTWIIPNINGIIWLKASSVKDTTIFTFDDNIYQIGENMPSQPQICWSDGYSTFPSYSQNLFNYARILDVSCGWGSNSTRKWTTVLSDDGTIYSTQLTSEYIHISEILGNPLLPSPLFQTTALDTIAINLGSIYSMGDTIAYRMHLYFYNASDSTLRRKDLLNNIDSILAADLKVARSTHWLASPSLGLYNIQSSKISGQYIPSTTNLETLNDNLFEPSILIGAPSVSGRGTFVYRFTALDYPNNASYAEDVARIFQNLTMHRDYFRGIDPKARKKGR